MTNIDSLKISISILIPLLLFALGYWKEIKRKKAEEKQGQQDLINFTYNLLDELLSNLELLSRHIEEIIFGMFENYSKGVFITIDSHTGGIIKRLTKIDSKEYHEALNGFKISSDHFRRMFREIDFFEDFYDRLLHTITQYQSRKTELKKEFRANLNEFMNFHSQLLTKFRFESKNLEYFNFCEDLTEKYLSIQNDDLSYHYEEYLVVISNYVRSHHRSEYFANEVITKVKRQKIILDDLREESMTYGGYLKQMSNELELSLTEVKQLTSELEKHVTNDIAHAST